MKHVQKLGTTLRYLLCMLLFIQLSITPFAQSFAESTIHPNPSAPMDTRPENEVVLIVSPTGDDVSGDGSLGHPYKTLEKAKDIVQHMSKTAYSRITIYLRQGTYFSSDTITFESEDSGTASCPIIYSSYPNEVAVLTGAQTIPSSKFKKVTDSVILNRLPNDAVRTNLVTLNLSDLGIDEGTIQATGFGVEDSDVIAPVELFFDHIPMTLSRWPNDSFTTISAIVSDRTFEYGPLSQPNSWKFNSDMWVCGYFVASGWGDCSFNITELNTKLHQLTTDMAPTYGYNLVGKNFYFYNILEEIDMPGEYYIDRETHNFYFYPPYDLSQGVVTLSVSANTLIEAHHLSYTHFNNLIMEGTRNSGINITDSSTFITLDGCVIRDIGKTGLFFNEVTNCTLRNSEVKYTGKGGLYIYGGNRETLAPSNIVVYNNHLTDVNRIWKTYNSGITIVASVGCRISHNLIHKSPHTAILFGGNDILIDHNEIYNVTQETDDAGAIYSGRDYTYGGTRICNNYIHDGRSEVTFCGTSGIYLDDGMSSAFVHGNIISDFHQGMVLGGGRNHVITENVINACDDAINFDDRNQALTPTDLLKLDTYVPFYNLPNWKAKYPLVYKMSQDPNPGFPKGNVLVNNDFYRSGSMNLAQLVLEYGNVSDNTTYSNLLTSQNLSTLEGMKLSEIGQFPNKTTQMDACFSLKMPLNQSRLSTKTEQIVTFAWQGLSYADQYQLIIAKDSQFKQLVTTELVTATYCSLATLENDTTYYWKVIALSDAQTLSEGISCANGAYSFTLSGQ